MHQHRGSYKTIKVLIQWPSVCLLICFELFAYHQCSGMTWVDSWSVKGQLSSKADCGHVAVLFPKHTDRAVSSGVRKVLHCGSPWNTSLMGFLWEKSFQRNSRKSVFQVHFPTFQVHFPTFQVHFPTFQVMSVSIKPIKVDTPSNNSVKHGDLPWVLPLKQGHVPSFLLKMNVGG